jgi:hypothetical protein
MLSLRSFWRQVSDSSSLVSPYFLLMQSFSLTAFHVGKANLRLASIIQTRVFFTALVA